MSHHVFFLHGFMGSRRDWDRVIDALDGVSEFSCHALDLPGHGDCHQWPQEGAVNIKWMADQVRRQIDELGGIGDEPVHLVGYSMGGRIALYLTLEDRQRIASVILESASPGLGGEKARQARRAVDAQRARQMVDQGLETFLAKWYELPIFGGLNEHPAFLAMCRRRADGDGQRLAQVIREMSPGAQPNLWPRLGELAVPSLWVAGREDEKYVDIVGRAVREAGDATARIVDGAGHNTHLMAPGRFAELVERWVKDQDRRRR